MKLQKWKTTRFKSTKTQHFTLTEDKWDNIAQILESIGQPSGENDFTYQVDGVYSLPEYWSKLQASGSVDQWGFNVKLCDAVLCNGKLYQRELSEEEKKEIENKKKPPPKINKKDLEAVRLEEERMAKEAKEKEDAAKAFQDHWDTMDPQEQFYYLKELPTKEPWVAWNESRIATIKKTGQKWIELEQDVIVNSGALLELCFVPNPDENDKKRPKPKGISPEEVKPIYAVAWVDFSELKKTPGLLKWELRCNLQLKSTYEKRIDDLEARDGVKYLNPMDPKVLELIKENEEENLDILEKTKTYIHIIIQLSDTINPILPHVPIPEPIDWIKKKDEPVKVYTVSEIEQDLLRQFKIAIAAIAKTYDEGMGESAKMQLVKREKGNVWWNAKKYDERENNNNKFLDKFNTSGRADLLKEKLKKFIVKIVREKYNKKGQNVKGVFKDKRDQFYSEWYAYLTDYVKKATEKFVELKKDELHEHVWVSFGQSSKEIMNYAIRQNNEPEDKRLLRLSKENEWWDDFKLSVHYFNKRLALEQNKEAWLSYCNLVKKLDDINEVEKAIVKAITIDEEVDDLNMKIVYCGWLYWKGEKFIKNGINWMNLILLKKGWHNTNCIFNAFLAFLYKQVGNETLFSKFFEAAKLFKMKEIPPEELKPKVVEVDPSSLVVDPKKEKEKEKEREKELLKNPNFEQERLNALKKGNPKLNPDYRPPELSDSQCDWIWFDTINWFNQYNFYEISEKLLAYVNEATKSKSDFKLEQAKIYLFRKEYQKVLDLCDPIIKENPICYNAYLLEGHAYYYMKHFNESESNYIRAIRFKPRDIEFNLEMLVKLGNIYILNQKWYDAKIVYQQILKNSVEHSFAWCFLGLALTKLGEFEAAEKALKEANLLDVENPKIWAYWTIFCISTKRKYQAWECLNEWGKVEFSDIDLLKEIAEMFYNNNEYEISANIYIKIKKIDPSETEAYLRIAEIYYKHFESKSKEAINILREGLDAMSDEQGRNEIREMIEEYEKIDEQKLNNGINILGNLNNDDDLNLSEINAKGELMLGVGDGKNDEGELEDDEEDYKQGFSRKEDERKVNEIKDHLKKES